jgi:hypothetical protein
VQDHDQGELLRAPPDTEEAEPKEHSEEEGAKVEGTPLVAPQTPLSCAWQLMEEPLLLPTQDQLQGPEPETDVCEPEEQKPLEGADVTILA